MADNAVTATPGTGITFASDQIGGIEYPRAKVVWGADGTATDTSAAAPLPVVQTGALPAGTALIGKVGIDQTTPGTTNKVTVGSDVVHVIIDSGAGSGGTAVADEAAFTMATTSVTPIGGVYNSTPDTLTTGKAGALQMTAARGLHSHLVDAAGATIATLPVSVASVPSHAVTNAGTFATQVDGAALTALQLIDDVVYAEDVAAQAADKGVAILAVRRDADTTLVGADNDYANLQVNAAGSLKVAITAGAGSGGTSIADEAAFTMATTSVTPIAAVYNSTPDTLSTGKAGALQMTAARGLHSHLVDAVGASLALGSGANGSTVLRVALATDSPGITATVAHDAADSGDPLKIGGYAKAAAPTDVSADGDRVNAWYLRNGAAAQVLTAAGALIGGDATNGLDVDVTRLPALVAGSALIGKVGIDQTTPGTTDSVTVATGQGAGAAIGATSGAAVITDANGTIQQYLRGIVKLAITAGGWLVSAAGTVAHDGADAGNPVQVGGRARSSEIAAVASDDRVDFVSDLAGKQIVLPYANPENFVSGAITSAMTGTTSTSLVAAPASGLRNYITQITVSNAHATVGTDIIIQDGSGGTTLYTIPAAAVYGGAAVSFPVPLRQPTTATALYCANVTTGASTKVSASGYKGV